MKGTVEAKVEHVFTASAERVYDAWLEPEIVRQWMTAATKQLGLPGDVRRCEIDARVGGEFTFSDMREDGEAVHWGTYLEMERPRKLVFTWFTSGEEAKKNKSVVTLTLEPTDSGCIATIVHAFDDKYAEYVPQTEQGWGAMLEQIGNILE